MALRPFGMRAMMSLRLDRFFGSWQREFSPDYTAGETGLDQPIPDLAAMNYEASADYDVAALFASATYTSDDAGGSASM